MPEKIDLDPKSSARFKTFLIYGPTRSGKTRFAATFPSPLFLSDYSEKGWETIAYMPPEAFYDGKPPEVWGIKGAGDMVRALGEAEQALQKEPGRWRTIVIDSLTFYSGSYLSELEAGQKAGDNRWQVYRSLEQHLRYFMIRTHQLPAHVVWLCLDKLDEKGMQGRPRIDGQMSEKAPALCQYLMYQRVFTDEGEVKHEVRTRTWGAFLAGGRDGGALPDPMEPSYRAIEQAMGWEPIVKAPAPARRVVVTRR